LIIRAEKNKKAQSTIPNRTKLPVSASAGINTGWKSYKKLQRVGKMVKSSSTSDIEMPKNYTDALAFADNMAEQLRVAGLLQRDFLPGQLPDSSRLRWAVIFLPAEWVSGDIYDVVRLDEQHIGFYVADVVGHGMAAALLTIFLKQALVMRQTVGNSYRIFSPAEVMKNLNLAMTGQKLSGHQFVTCCYCLANSHNNWRYKAHCWEFLNRLNSPSRPYSFKAATNCCCILMAPSISSAALETKQDLNSAMDS
jgi:hypothetical protein